MNIYLDIDGTLIHEDLTVRLGQPAAGLSEFLQAIQPHNLFWLTTHCREGDPSRPIEILKRVTDRSLHPIIESIQGTVWDTAKTQGIDWSQDFIWFDNEISDFEHRQFAKASQNQQAMEVNIRSNPNHLIEITSEVLPEL
jgi:hypothetical protein